MAWNIQDSAHEMPVSLYQRDTCGAAFSDSTTKMRYLSRINNTAKDDQCHAADRYRFQPSVQGSTGGHAERFHIIAQDQQFCCRCCYAAKEKAWVLAGLRRSGFLAVRPDATGLMRWCGEEDWAKDKPLESKRISKPWLDNRLAHALDEGKRINEPSPHHQKLTCLRYRMRTCQNGCRLVSLSCHWI